VFKAGHGCNTQHHSHTSTKAKDLNRHFSKEDTLMANQHMKSCSSLAIGEMQINTIIKYNLTSTGMVVIKKTASVKIWRK
jgi:hypothetical protein